LTCAKLTRRDLVGRLGSGLAFLGLASACSRLDTLPNRTTGGDRASAPAQVNATETLVLGQTAGIPSTDPFPSGPALNAFKAAMFNPLVSLDDKGQPVPLLAESWAFSDDRLRLRLKLREGVKFHSGRPLTAEAVKWTIERAQDPTSQAAVGGEFAPIQVRAIDLSSVELQLPDDSYPTFSRYSQAFGSLIRSRI
jgi:peptide/nickel transport system substrate-binding protein